MKTTTMLLSGILFVGGMGLNSVAAFAEAGPIPADRETKAQVKFIEDDSKQPPVDPTDPDPDKPEVPVDPTNPDKPVEPGTNGPLSLDYASILDFGEQKISNKDQVYFAAPQLFRDSEGKIDEKNPVPNYAQVTDRRGGEKGWTLSVKQNGQFKSLTNKKELKGAEITFKNGQVASKSASKAPGSVKESFSLTADGTGIAENVVSASANEGFGTWVYRFGDESTMAKSIQLSVPGSSVKEADAYQTTLTWTLKDVPTNNK